MGINMTVSLIVDDCSLLFAVAIELVIRWRYLKKSCRFPGAACNSDDGFSVVSRYSGMPTLSLGECFVHIWCRSSVLYVRYEANTYMM
jgi:hypothetical protein